MTAEIIQMQNCERSEEIEAQDTKNALPSLAFNSMNDGERGGYIPGAMPRTILENPRKSESELGFRFIHAAELIPSSPEYLVYGLVETDSLMVVYGDSESMKSAFMFDVAFCVAANKDFHGLKVKSGLAILIIGEGKNGFTLRKSAWEEKYKIDLGDYPLFVSSAPAVMTDPDFVKMMMAQIDKIAEEHGAPVLIVVDTLAKNFGDRDENSTQDMSAYVNALNSLRVKYQATVATVHHVGQADRTRGRGSRALKQGVDSEYFFERLNKREIIRVTNMKMKEGARPEPMTFMPVVVSLPLTDAEGNNVTSIIIERVENLEPQRKASDCGIGKNHKKAIVVLERLIENRRDQFQNNNFDQSVDRVTVEDWRRACVPAVMNREAWRSVKDKLPEGVTINNGCVEMA